MKMKTHRGAAKRFKKTGGGGYKRKRAFLRHGMRKRNQDTKRVLRKKAMVSAEKTYSFATKRYELGLLGTIELLNNQNNFLSLF